METAAALRQMIDDAPARIAEVESLDALQSLEVDLLGRTSAIAEARRTLGTLDPESRRNLGLLVNEAAAVLTGHESAPPGPLLRPPTPTHAATCPALTSGTESVVIVARTPWAVEAAW